VYRLFLESQDFCSDLFRLACGFLLVILSCALFSNWLPLLVVATYVLAPLPNAICARYAAHEDFMSDSTGYFPSLPFPPRLIEVALSMI